MNKANQNKHSLRSALLLGASAAAALSVAAPAMAQDQSVETVVVTGSRIPQQGIYSSSPVTAVGQQELKLEGTTDVSTLLNNLPSVFADFGNSQANGASGTATVNLRNLGSARTLVLVDGKRLMPGDPALPVADLNNIPAALVDHVEVLTGGASAVYGSDAEAGVVNFIMRKDFQGVEVDGQYTVNQADNNTSKYRTFQNNAGFPNAQKDWWGGQSNDVTLLMGTNTGDNKGNVTAYLSYRHVNPVTEDKRDFSACSLSTNFTSSLKCAGSSNYDRIISFDTLFNGGGGGGGDFFGGNTTWVPYTGVPAQKFNYGPLNYLQRPDDRYSGGFFGHYEVNKALDIYTSFMFADDHTVAQIAPSGAFLGSGPLDFPGTASPGYFQINCSNPLMTAQQNALLCNTPGSALVGGRFNGAGNLTPGQALVQIGRRNIEGGNRQDDLRHTSYRMNIGAKGDLGNNWSYDVYAQYGVSLFSETYDNEFSKQRTENGLEIDPATGKCFAAEPDANGITADAKCVPLDLFHGLGAITPTQLGYVAAQGFKEGYTREQIVSGSLTGDLGEWGIQSPWAKSPVGVSIGAEYRSEAIQLKTSRDFQINDLAGQGGATLPVPLSGFNVVEGFTEVRVPIVQGAPFFEDLTATGGYRYSSYNISGSVTSYKYGLEWQVVDDVKLRGSVQRAVRAPNVLELFAPANIGLFGGNDPCATSTAGACATVPHAGNATLLSCPAAQCNQQSSGNINLKPETSDTKTFGLVFTPTFIDGFTATIDYFNIKVDNYISFISPSLTLNGCYGTLSPTSQAFFCPFVHRSATGTIFGAGYVGRATLNLPYLQTKGVDFETNYTTDMADWGWHDAGSLAFNFLGTYTQHLITQPIPTAAVSVGSDKTYECAGMFGITCGIPTPKWRHKFRITWSSPWDFDLSLNWRHLGGVKFDGNSTNTNLNSGAAFDVPDNKIGSFDYFDLSGNWTVSEGLELRAGIDNLFDKTPPTVDSNALAISGPPFGNGNTFPGVYDSLGRTIFVGGTYKF
ncbi:MAG TPA: TonB-dependent receptor [Rhizomicrobium sp.]